MNTGRNLPALAVGEVQYLSVYKALPVRIIIVKGMEFRYISWKDAEEINCLKKEKEMEENRRKRIQESKIYKRLVMVEL